MKEERVSILDILSVYEKTKILENNDKKPSSFRLSTHRYNTGSSSSGAEDDDEDDDLDENSDHLDSSEDEMDVVQRVGQTMPELGQSTSNQSTPRSGQQVSESHDGTRTFENVSKTVSGIVESSGSVVYDMHNRIVDERQMLDLIQKLELECDHPIDYKKEYLDPKRKCTLLHTAAKLDFLTVMQHLLDKQPDLLEAQDRSGATPIFYACSSAHSKSVTMLAINGACLNMHDKYEASPLSTSLNSKNKAKGFTVARALLGFHVDVEYKVYCGNTILHLACREGDLEKVQFIVEDLKHNIFRKNTKQESCLFRAVKHENLCKYLLEYCQNEIGHEKLLKLLFMKNDQGRTIVHHCCAKGYLGSLVNIVQSLKDDTGKLDLIFNEKDTVYGMTPLHICVLAEQEEIFAVLIRAKEVILDVQNNIGDTPLHIAVRNEKLAIVKELYHVYTSKSLHLKNSQKKTILNLAKEHDIDLNKLEKELQQDNAGMQKEGFWSSLFGNKKSKTKSTRFHSSSSTAELQNRMSNVSKRKSLLINVSWDPTKYEVGNEEIDSQHMQLIGWLKNLSEAALTAQSHWAVGYTIGCLIEYTEYHFEDEQQLMFKYRKGLGEEYVKKHLEEHETFTSKMKAVQKEYMKNHSASLDIELLNYLVNWLLKHINFTDRKLAAFINTHKPDDQQ